MAALLASGMSAVVPVTAGQDVPTEQTQNTRTLSQTQQNNKQAATTHQISARAAYGVAMMGGDLGYWEAPSSGPWGAPLYNQRKARRDARRVNRSVRR